jgi:hypothetical protein
MKTIQAIRYFGGRAGVVLAMAAGMGFDFRGGEYQEVKGWGVYPPAARQYQLEVLSGGVLRAERRTPPRKGVEFRRTSASLVHVIEDTARSVSVA